MKLLLYCTKAKPYLYKTDDTMIEKMNGDYHTQLNEAVLTENLNGKIVAECDFEVHKFKTLNRTIEDYEKFNRNDMLYIFERSNLSYTELIDYLGENSEGYAIHIKNLHIFDKPKKLTDYHCKTNKNDELCLNGGCGYKFFYKAPQNMMYAYDGEGNKYIVISIQPQWMCLILNRTKYVEVRKVIVKEMLQ